MAAILPPQTQFEEGRAVIADPSEQVEDGQLCEKLAESSLFAVDECFVKNGTFEVAFCCDCGFQPQNWGGKLPSRNTAPES
ncbi:hypothetical protein Q31b_32220 [Novipirellula aureliae]|uniref:Uncharacterized protein n=1 Tax=Novipirellula aureliae TaxID=2527966 RepID=A0A5C6DXX3_9BACT|nr:hypothetical protein [Novipirellula aureliae]TWU39906.1 hypothetical protein Q31b_32220 [Novipirellula aureliae]